MNISTKSVWLAVHRIFDEAQIEVGESMSLTDLMKAWGEIGLRQQDLAGALENLTRTGHLRLEMSEQGPTAHLVSKSFGALNEDGRDQAALRSLALLREARQVPPHIKALRPAQPDNRRSADRPEHKK
jgi:hypothetical protein